MSDRPSNVTDTTAFARYRAFLDGWDAAERCLAETLSWVPDDQVVAVIRRRQRRLGIEGGAS